MQLIRDLHWQPVILLSACQCTANQLNSSFSRFLESSNSRVGISCYSKYTATEQICREDEKTRRETKKEHVSYLWFLDINCRQMTVQCEEKTFIALFSSTSCLILSVSWHSKSFQKQFPVCAQVLMHPNVLYQVNTSIINLKFFVLGGFWEHWPI